MIRHLELSSQEARGGQAGTGIAGGGVSVDPQAFIVVDPEGKAHLLTLRRSGESKLTQAIELVPEVLEKMARKRVGVVSLYLRSVFNYGAYGSTGTVGESMMGIESLNFQ